SLSRRRPADVIGRSVEARLEEAVGLAQAIRLDVVGAEIAPIARPRPSSLLGSGTLDTLGALISDNGVGVVVIDGALSPVQPRTSSASSPTSSARGRSIARRGAGFLTRWWHWSAIRMPVNQRCSTD